MNDYSLTNGDGSSNWDDQGEVGDTNLPAQGLLEKSIGLLGDNCDGATSQDGRGFNKKDVDFFKPHVETVQKGGRIVDPLRPAVIKRLQKYGSQIATLGININEVLEEEGENRAKDQRDEEISPNILADLILSKEHFFALQEDFDEQYELYLQKQLKKEHKEPTADYSESVNLCNRIVFEYAEFERMDQVFYVL